MSLIYILKENVVEFTPDVIKRLIKKKYIKVVRSEFYKEHKRVLDKETAEESFNIMMKYVDLNELIEKMYEADPTDGNKYIKWILSNYMYPIIENHLMEYKRKFNEDYYKLEGYLDAFENNKVDLKRLGYSIDINDYDSLQELYDVIQYVRDPRPDEEDHDIEYVMKNDFYINNDQADLVYRDEYSMIVVPKTVEASKFYGCTTEWCTIFPDNFKGYTEDGILFIFIKPNNTGAEQKAQLAVNYMYETDIEFRTADDTWVKEPFMYITVDEAEAIKDYLLDDPKYTYEVEPADAESLQKFHHIKDGYSIVMNGGQYYIKFKSWNDLVHILGEGKWIGERIFGDGHWGDFNNYLSYDDISWQYIDLENKTIEEIKKRIKELFAENAHDDDPEFIQTIDSISDKDELHELLEQRESSKYEDILDTIATAMSHGYNEADNDADYSEAYNQATEHIANQIGMDIERGIKWEDNHLMVPMHPHHTPDGGVDEIKVMQILSQVIDIDHLMGDEEEKKYEDFHQPQNGFQGTPEDEYINERIRDRLYL